VTDHVTAAGERQNTPLRSVLFAPGNEPRKVNKVSTFGADCIVLDLEDAVPDAEKAATRPKVRAALPDMTAPLVTVRVNSFETGLTEDDVNGVVGPGLDGIVLPKVVSPDEVERVDELITKAEAREGLPAGRIRVLATVETCLGVLRGDAIAAAKSDRLITLAFGSGDLTLDLDLPTIRRDNTGDEIAFARSKLIYDARSAGLPRPIDGPYLAVRDLEGFEEDCMVARKMGYQGKICVYPPQAPIANRLFAPDPDEVRFCHKVITEFEAAVARGSAAITVDGVFIDYPILTKAQRIIALAEMLADRDATAPTAKAGA
jgi:citrate lyase subunit beta/citryl-CoA lyase